MNPGQGEVCRDCRHFHPESWQMGHPSPCAKVGWVGQKHAEPSLSEDGRRCDEYDGPETDPQAPGLETESAEICHGENAPDGGNGDSGVEALECASV
jgi:hypothetical protein